MPPGRPSEVKKGSVVILKQKVAVWNEPQQRLIEGDFNNVADAVGVWLDLEACGRPKHLAFCTVGYKSAGIETRTMYGAHLLCEQPTDLMEVENPYIYALCSDMVVRRVFLTENRNQRNCAVAVHGAPHYIMGELVLAEMSVHLSNADIDKTIKLWRFVSTGATHHFRLLHADDRLNPSNIPGSFWCAQCDGLFNPGLVSKANGIGFCKHCFNMQVESSQEYQETLKDVQRFLAMVGR